VAYITIIIIVVLAYVSVYNCLVYASKTTTTEMTVIHYLTFANKLIAYLTSNFYYSGKNNNIFWIIRENINLVHISTNNICIACTSHMFCKLFHILPSKY